jgi:hypothetical protein
MITKIMQWVLIVVLLLVVSLWGSFGSYQMPQGLVVGAAGVLMALCATLQA